MLESFFVTEFSCTCNIVFSSLTLLVTGGGMRASGVKISSVTLTGNWVWYPC